jgi:cytidine deaminase
MDFDDLLNLLAKRRLGLCGHDSLHNKKKSVNCEEIGSLHIACLINKKIPKYISTNVYKNYNGIFSYHAENQVFSKLPKNKKSKVKSINLLVIRVTRNGNIVNSKPCIRCLQDMVRLPYEKGYKVRNIYYSNEDGKIIRKTLTDLLYNEELHMSRFYREKNFKISLNKIM